MTKKKQDAVTKKAGKQRERFAVRRRGVNSDGEYELEVVFETWDERASGRSVVGAGGSVLSAYDEWRSEFDRPRPPAYTIPGRPIAIYSVELVQGEFTSPVAELLGVNFLSLLLPEELLDLERQLVAHVEKAKKQD